jgi:hypothetical protein
MKALLILLCAVPLSAAAQTQWMLFAGPQLDRVTYRPPTNTNRSDQTSSYDLEFGPGSGTGWHVGAALRAGNEKVMFRTGFTWTRSAVSVPYEERSSNGGHGGGGTAISNGQLDDVFTLIETPLLVSLGNEQLRLEMGVAPWLLLSAYSKDTGVRTSAGWSLVGPSSGTRTSTYDHSGDVTEKFAPYGLMGSFGASAVIRKHFLVGASSTFNLPRTYKSDSDYSVGRMMLRLSIGYVFTKG